MLRGKAQCKPTGVVGIAIDTDTKLVGSYMLAKRDPFCARAFVRNVCTDWPGVTSSRQMA